MAVDLAERTAMVEAARRPLVVAAFYLFSCFLLGRYSVLSYIMK